MPVLAPNLNALLGSTLAAQLVAAAGGIENLASMPSQNIEAVGAHKQSLAGLSASAQAAKISLISQSDLVLKAPSDLKKRAVRLVMGKAAIAARVDQFNKSDNLGQTGAKLHAEIEAALGKAAELPPARAVKPLPLPAEPRKKKRGGARARKWKEKYGVTEMQKRAGRVAFGESTGDVLLDGTSAGASMLHAEVGAGRIRASAPAKQRALAKPVNDGEAKNSSLAFTASHGIELKLSNLEEPKDSKRQKTDLFSSSLGFSTGP
jgi:U4/U6 small nuclear ribonucleoprotein PRP31